MSEVQGRVDRLKKEQKKRDALAAKIKVNLTHTPPPDICTKAPSHYQAMESKLLMGGRSIVDHTHQQQKQLDQQQQEMALREVSGSHDCHMTSLGVT